MQRFAMQWYRQLTIRRQALQRLSTVSLTSTSLVYAPQWHFTRFTPNGFHLLASDGGRASLWAPKMIREHCRVACAFFSMLISSIFYLHFGSTCLLKKQWAMVEIRMQHSVWAGRWVRCYRLGNESQWSHLVVNRLAVNHLVVNHLALLDRKL